MAVPIIPRIERGRLYFQTVDVPVPRRRCDDCQLHLTPDVLHALDTCPRWGKPRHGVETCCPAFVAKDGGR